LFPESGPPPEAVAAEYMRKILTDAAINVEVAPFDILGVVRQMQS
jgi:hypothetical protein